MAAALETLFYPLEQGLVDLSGRRIAFLGARFHPALQRLDQAALTLQQNFKPFAEALEKKGYAASPVLPDAQKAFDAALVLLPKNAVESRYELARALSALRPGGIVLVAADNKAGGGRIKSIMNDFGLGEYQDVSKNKARAAWAVCKAPKADMIEKALREGKMQPVLEGAFLSQPGIFGWDKIDRGSEILAAHIPDNLAGRGADFGCGYGYLARVVLEKHPKVKMLHCLDADYRAVTACTKNLEPFAARTQCIWADIMHLDRTMRNLDFVVMNPPFHEGKKTDIALGKACIESAANVLRPRGSLWMVANAHLPYEAILEARFYSFKKLFEGQGFKVFCAYR